MVCATNTINYTQGVLSCSTAYVTVHAVYMYTVLHTCAAIVKFLAILFPSLWELTTPQVVRVVDKELLSKEYISTNMSCVFTLMHRESL